MHDRLFLWCEWFFLNPKIDQGYVDNVTSTLNSPIIVVHSNILKRKLILIMRIIVSHIDFQSTVNF